MVRPILLAPGVWRLPTLGRSLVNSFAFEEPDGRVTLVDAGLRGATRRGDNDLLDVAGGVRILHTPGHTPGHCSLLHEPSGVLITGDALFNWRMRMRYSYALFCTNVSLSRETADRLGEVDYEIAAFTHGPEIRDRARERVRAFLLSKGAGA